MEITSFKLSANENNLELTITDAATLTTLRLWTDKTYKEYTNAIDLSNKLTGATTENITITPLDINESYLDGVYFIEAENPTTLSIELTSKLNRFKECILDKAKSSLVCDECLKEADEDLKNSHILLISLINAIDIRDVNSTLLIKKSLDKYCSNACRSCGDYTNVEDNNQLNNNEPGLAIIVDGGSID